VIVKLKITASLPGELETPCFTELFKKHKYVSKCGVVMATQMLINDQTGDTVIEPAKKYVNTAKRMIDYLFASSVDISLYQPGNSIIPVFKQGNLRASTTRSVSFVPQPRIPLAEMALSLSGNYFLPTSLFPPILPNGGQNGDGWGFTLFPTWGEVFYTINYKISIEIPSASPNPNETIIIRYPGFLESGRSNLLGWDGNNNGKQPFSTLPVSGTTTELSGTISPFEYPQFLGLKVGFDDAGKIRNGTYPTPRIRLLLLVVNFITA